MTLAGDKRSARGGSSKQSAHTSYEADTYAWALEQSELLSRGKLDQIDVANIADEIADLGKREKQRTRRALALVIQHLLKWDYQPDRRTRSWTLTIRVKRRHAEEQLADNPSLAARFEEIVCLAYNDARDKALIETGLPESVFPTTLPYSRGDILNRPIVWPEN